MKEAIDPTKIAEAHDTPISETEITDTPEDMNSEETEGGEEHSDL